MAGKLGLLVTLRTEFHAKPFPAQGPWRPEAFWRGGWGCHPYAQVSLRPRPTEPPAMLWLPFTTCTYFLTITCTSRYLWASPQHCPELSTELPGPSTSPGEGTAAHMVPEVETMVSRCGLHSPITHHRTILTTTGQLP